MGKTIRINVVCPIGDDPTSYYRGLGPLSALQKLEDSIQLSFPQQSNWATQKFADIVFLQRPCTPDHFNILVLAKDLGIPVWVDFDDDNLAVPEDNPMEPQYSSPPIKDALVKLARYADVLTVSTKALQDKFSIYNKSCHVIQNALDDSLLHLRQIPDRPRNKRIMWRGTGTHNSNLKVVEASIIKLGKAHPDWAFSFLGYKPLEIKRALKNCEIISPFPIPSIIEYYKNMVAAHPTAIYYPLAADDHSQSRSRVSWLEATYASAIFIGPKHPEFTWPGTLNFADALEFESHVESVINGTVDINKNVKESWDEIQSNHMLSRVNDLRLQLIHQLAKK